MINRYAQLNVIIDAIKPTLIVEVGTNAGNSAELMIRAAAKHSLMVEYIGFDLFEAITDEISAAELNAKQMFTQAQAADRLQHIADDLAKEGRVLNFQLVSGDTKVTLPRSEMMLRGAIDRHNNKAIVFLDGGHSVETITSDLFHLDKAGFQVIVCDDWYENDKDGKGVDTEKWGCNKPLRATHKNIAVLPKTDPVRDGGHVRLVCIGWQPDRISIQVQTRNCVPDEQIQNNVAHALGLGLRLFPFCKAHNGLAVLCSGGYSLFSYLPRIKEMQQKGAHVFAVKHAHDMLLEHGIVPFATVLLDPRGHVSQFIENPHPDVHYFVASGCHHTTFDKLLAKNARIWLYHAAVGAGEDKIIRNGMAIAGGPSAGTRALTLLYFLGFRRYEMFAYDCCVPVKPDMNEINPASGDKKWCEVQVNDRFFWSTHELLAEVQFMDKGVWPQMVGCTFNIHGDGMMAHVHAAKRSRIERTEFEDLFAGYGRPGAPIPTAPAGPTAAPASGADQS